jgi:glycosyltransferase involved in cell wall biosynthesis
MRSFRYAPERFELVGYSRSLEKDETMKWGAMLSAPLYAAGAHLAVRRELARRPYDLLQAHWVVPNGLVVGPLSKRVPLAVGLHGSDVFMAEKPGLRRVVRRALSRVRVLTGCSPELVDRVCALGFPAERSRVIPYGVDSRKFAPAETVADRDRALAWRRKLGIPEGAPMLLSVGRMATKKGYQVLLDGLEDLMGRLPELHLVLAGAGDRLEEFRRRAEPWEGRVHFPGAVLRDTLPDLYRAADAFTLPAVHDPKGNVDGLPNVILEGMASGLPVIATAISGIPLAVEDRVNGRLVPEQQTAPLVEALVETLSDPEAARRMGELGRQQAVEKLSWRSVAARYRAAYELALSGQ